MRQQARQLKNTWDDFVSSDRKVANFFRTDWPTVISQYYQQSTQPIRAHQPRKIEHVLFDQ